MGYPFFIYLYTVAYKVVDKTFILETSVVSHTINTDVDFTFIKIDMSTRSILTKVWVYFL